MKKKMLIIRGLPGSGKSTLAKDIERKYCFDHVEADMYFVNKFGEYNYHPEQIKQAHDWCLNTVEDLMNNNKDVVISNTFTTYDEVIPYLNLSKKFKYNFAIICCKKSYGTIHKVPEQTMERMKLRFENIPGEVLR